jgi:hypothetical protein
MKFERHQETGGLGGWNYDEEFNPTELDRANGDFWDVNHDNANDEIDVIEYHETTGLSKHRLDVPGEDIRDFLDG